MTPIRAYSPKRTLLRYLVVYDDQAGSPGRYLVLALTSRDPVVIGRELPLTKVAPLLVDYERVAQEMFFTGSRQQVLAIQKAVVQLRRHTGGSRGLGSRAKAKQSRQLA